jgi:hypothetical protein
LIAFIGVLIFRASSVHRRADLPFIGERNRTDTLRIDSGQPCGRVDKYRGSLPGTRKNCSSLGNQLAIAH